MTSGGRNQPLLQVEGMRVEIPTRKGTLVAVDGVSFHINEGEVLGVVGESGAGKSLTGAAIIGLLEPPCHIAGGQLGLDRCQAKAAIGRHQVKPLPPRRVVQFVGNVEGILRR